MVIMMPGFAIVPLVTFFLYVFMLGIFISAKKNDLIRSFMVFLAFMALWSGGSFLMRIQFMDMVEPWYHLSFVGIWIGVITMDMLVCKFAETKFSLVEYAISGLIVLMLIANFFTGTFLDAPTPVYLENGQVSFVYTMTIGTYLMYGLLAVCFVFIGGHVVETLRKQLMPPSAIRVLILGTAILVLGNVIIMLPPFSGIPLDIVGGAFFALSVFIALYYKHLVSLSLAFSRKTYALISFISLLFFVLFAAPAIEAWIRALPAPFSQASISLVAIVSAVWAVVVYWLVCRISEKLFLRDFNARVSGLQEYHSEISRSLEIYQVGDYFCRQALKDFRDIRAARMCAVDSTGNLVIVGSSSSFEVGRVVVKSSSVILDWFALQSEPVFMDEFVHSNEYRGLWEEEKRYLSALSADYIVPLRDDGELLGAAFLTLRSKERRLPVADQEHLINIMMLTASSVRNSILYERVAKDAKTDDLTGLLNRKYFLSLIDELYGANPAGALSLIIVNVDDFKLYNQLYGERVGDEALKNIADIISHSIPEGCSVSRYGGKEFGILMPGFDTRKAYQLAQNLQRQIYDLNRTPSQELGALKIITTSIGICSIPFGASNVKQLIANADMSVYQVKQKGKNGIKVFSVSDIKEGRAPKTLDRQGTYSSYESTIYALAAAIDAKDHYTFTHSNNVAYYASALARACNLDEDTVEIIREAGLLHDIGKIGIPENILNKKDRLTNEEYEIMKKHPENAVSIIRHLPSLDYVIPAVVGHHERWDGKGYPRQLQGEDIPLSARILCVADSFDAITTKRVYQDIRSLEEALRILEEGAGSQFDPRLVHLFVKEIREGHIEMQNKQSVMESA